MADLTRMSWERLLSRSRYGTTRPDSEEDPRSPFQKDFDRVIFSSHFRRLGRKTQVHPLNENDNIHSRLSHSIETGSVGRSLGQHIGQFLARRGELPSGFTPDELGQIVQVACYAHDIGNPPFGHSGEESIKQWFKDHLDQFESMDERHLCDFTKFDGNAMSFRILTRTGFDGNNTGIKPTYAVLGALLKYPFSSINSTKDKFSCFQSEIDVLDSVAQALGLLGEPGNYKRHPLAYLTEAADDICYRIIDLEDAIVMNILPPSYMVDRFQEHLKLDEARLQDMSISQQNGWIRGTLVYKLIGESVQSFEANYDDIMDGTLSGSLLENSTSELSAVLLDVYREASQEIFFSRRKVELELGAYQSMSMLLDTFVRQVEDLCKQGGSCDHIRKIESIVGRHRVQALDKDHRDCPYHAVLMLLDYISGMTDQYATAICRRFIGIGG